MFGINRDHYHWLHSDNDNDNDADNNHIYTRRDGAKRVSVDQLTANALPLFHNAAPATHLFKRN